MKTLQTEVVDTGERRDVRGRKLVTAEEKVALLGEYQRSGLTQRAFAERRGIKYCTFTSWVAGTRKGKANARHFSEVAISSGALSSLLEVVLPEGIVVRGGDVESVVQLVKRLRVC